MQETRNSVFFSGISHIFLKRIKSKCILLTGNHTPVVSLFRHKHSFFPRNRSSVKDGENRVKFDRLIKKKKNGSNNQWHWVKIKTNVT